MKMHVLSGGRLRMRKSVYIPSAERSETIELPVSCVLVRHAQGNVLFDTGCHPSTQTDAAARWGTMAKAMIPIASQDENVLAELAKLNLKPDDIDVVVNSHFHSDHCGCNEFFKRATVICHLRELEAANAPDAVQKGYLPVDWKHPMPLETLDGERDLYGDGRILLVPLPGHTQGTLGSLVTTSKSGQFLLAADAVPLQINLDEGLMPRNTADVDAASRSMDEVRRLQREGATVIFGHDAQQWIQLKKGADAYE